MDKILHLLKLITVTCEAFTVALLNVNWYGIIDVSEKNIAFIFSIQQL